MIVWVWEPGTIVWASVTLTVCVVGPEHARRGDRPRELGGVGNVVLCPRGGVGPGAALQGAVVRHRRSRVCRRLDRARRRGDPRLGDRKRGGRARVPPECLLVGRDEAECPGLLAQNAYSVQWCTVPYPGSTTRYRLFREDDVNVACSGSVSTFQVDYLSQPSVWTTPGCTGGAVPTVTVALSVDVSPGTTAAGSYDLDDQIALRNATPARRCPTQRSWRRVGFGPRSCRTPPWT